MQRFDYDNRRQILKISHFNNNNINKFNFYNRNFLVIKGKINYGRIYLSKMR
jgi:hypothetical protein